MHPSPALAPQPASSPRIKLVDTLVALKNLTARLQDPTLSWVCLDCEATGFDPRLATPLLLQVGRVGGANVVVLPAFSAEELQPFLDTLSTKLVIGHNLNYDYRLLKSHYPATRFGAVYDTMLAEQVLSTGHYDSKKEWLQSVSLKALVGRYTGAVLDKEVRDTFVSEFPKLGNEWRPTEEQVEYAGKDVLVLPELVAQQYAKLMAQGLWRSAKLRFAALCPLADVELRGMLLDQDAWKAYMEALETERREAEVELRTQLSLPEMEWRQAEYAKALMGKAEWELARDKEEEQLRVEYEAQGVNRDEPWGTFKVQRMKAWRAERPNPGPVKLDQSPLNLQSHEQVKRAFHLLGLDVSSTDAKTRDRLLERFDLSDEQRSVLHVYTTYTKSAHNLGHFGQKVLDLLDEKGRLYPHFNIHLTETGRMSSQDPNFQNFPAESRVRHAFLADPGFLMLTSDFSGQELAIAAALSGDTQMREDICEGRDLYKELAVTIWGGTIDEVSDKQRKMAKAGLLGINYGQGAGGLYATKGIPKEQGEKIIGAIRKKYHRLVAWGDEQAFLAKQHGYVQTAAGTKRYFPNAKNMGWKVSTEARNAPIQGTAADIVYRMVKRLERLERWYIFLLNVVHDEGVTQFPNAFSAARELVEAEMCAAFYDVLPYDTYGVPARVDSHIAPFWTKQ